ncbi:MAG: caspase family protein [Saprospiraceae bacterium]|nr:caspase family protein [Saprospiraceae bacterium]
MNLYALLVGINDYPGGNALHQCVNDVGKMKTYLTGIADHFEDICIKTLTDAEATRPRVIEQFQTLFGQASNDDVALFYFSGHGAQEETAGRFPEEHDGALETLVCYAEGMLGTGQMLANKELRYLLHQLPNDPHLVTVIDACHSGDVVRAFQPEEVDSDSIRRITGVFEAREYDQFIFHDDQDVHTADGRLRIPFKNHVHLGACLASEASWEDSQGGVFTRYLLHLLKEVRNQVSYADIGTWAKISMKQVTKKQQSPIVTVQGKGALTARSAWLNLVDEEALAFPSGVLKRNPKLGWIYSRGSILGVRPKMTVLADFGDGKDTPLQVKEVGLDHAIVDMPSDLIDDLEDVRDKTFPARTEHSTFSRLKLLLNPIDHEPGSVARIRGLIEARAAAHGDVEITGVINRTSEENGAPAPVAADGVVLDNPDFQVNFFNGFVYFSLPDQDFQPLAEQIRLDAKNMDGTFSDQLQAFIKWHHFLTLTNPGKDYVKCPLDIQVECHEDTLTKPDERVFRVAPKAERSRSNRRYQTLKVTVTNTSRERLFVGVLVMTSDMGISADPFNNKVIEFQPGESKVFHDHEDSETWVFLEPYQEVYNWKEEWIYYKFIYNNHEDFTATLTSPEYLQEGLDPPLTHVDEARGVRRPGDRHEEVKRKWGTWDIRIELANDTFNRLSGELEHNLSAYVEDDDLAPFITELYFDIRYDGSSFKPFPRHNAQETAEAARGGFVLDTVNRIYGNARKRRFRRQRRTAPVAIAEGDSWFLFPKPGVRDTLDYLMDVYHLLSLAAAGDEVINYIEQGDLLREVRTHRPDYVLISGGGNDILGAGVAKFLNKDVTAGTVAEDFVNEVEFNKQMDALVEAYRMFFREIKALQSDIVIFIHGYDYIRSDPPEDVIRNGWVAKHMIAAGITDPAHRGLIITYIVDAFNTLMESLAGEHDHVRYVDHRGTVENYEWMDEIHPNNVGYRKVANNFLRAMAAERD